jgi:hypothetical protein
MTGRWADVEDLGSGPMVNRRRRDAMGMQVAAPELLRRMRTSAAG